MRRQTLADKVMNEYVIYGGIPTRRWKMIKDLESIGAHGATMLRYADIEAVDISSELEERGMTKEEFDAWSDSMLYGEA